ncbi:aldo/keto reductase [Metabacillus sp. GX 13764]|uniref:aldo/keto reductase n=1 Tax=Metabacillus kandeliae TaxID=2900151 RepID=UPI001E39DC40|nr:aldo/keto reductase [Metabacillus kandeliae]MCD7036446.1 aldo/keto reductase [Metabacillus kandeliae]
MVQIKDKLGFGTAPLGNMFREVPEGEAMETIHTAWEQGIRYFDTAPFYGAGLAELRLGEALSKYNRDDFFLSTKVGRVVEDKTEEKEGMFEYGRKNKLTNDYSEEATMRSIEQSLKRLKTDRLDFVSVHDVSPDFHGDEWVSQFAIARTGAFRALTRLREEGVIKSWGLGVNSTEPIELAIELEETTPDLCLLATQYTILNHDRALLKLMPRALERNVQIVAGAPFSSGAAVGGNNYNYGEVPDEITAKRDRLKHIAEKHGVSMQGAAIQFSMSHPAVAAVIPGSTKPAHAKENILAAKKEIPDAFWMELREQELVSPHAPLPID